MRLALLGEVLGHSLSPVIHQKLFEIEHIDSTYELEEIARPVFDSELRHALETFDGMNVTIPYKVDVIPYLDELSSEAKTIGAVNTIAKKEGKLIGYNTDYTGFKRTLDLIGAEISGKPAVVLGHGGASRAVIQCLFDEKASSITVISRHPEKVDEEFLSFAKARNVEIKGYDSLTPEADKYLLVNATPVGMYPKVGVSPIPADAAAAFPKVIDIIYNPAETQLLKDAKNADKSNGMYMLVMQAMAAEEIWMDCKISPQVAAKIAKDMMK